MNSPGQCRNFSLGTPRRSSCYAVGCYEKSYIQIAGYKLNFSYTTERRQLKEFFGDNPNSLISVQFRMVRRSIYSNPYGYF